MIIHYVMVVEIYPEEVRMKFNEKKKIYRGGSVAQRTPNFYSYQLFVSMTSQRQNRVPEAWVI